MFINVIYKIPKKMIEIPYVLLYNLFNFRYHDYHYYVLDFFFHSENISYSKGKF